MNDPTPTPGSACATPTIVSVNVSPGGIPKTPIDVGVVELGGLVGDGHDHDKHNTPVQAVCLIDIEDLDDLKAEGYDVYPGATGENVTCRNLDIDTLAVGDRLRFSGGVELELSKVRKPCYVLDAINPQLKQDIVGRCGFYGKVIAAGNMGAGETIEIVRAPQSASTTEPNA